MTTKYTGEDSTEQDCPNHVDIPATCSGTFIDIDGDIETVRDCQGREADCPSQCTYTPASTGALIQSWGRWTETPEDLRNNISYNQNCFNICGPRNYIQMIGGIPTCQEEFSCPNVGQNVLDNPSSLLATEEQLTQLGELADMCSKSENGGDITPNDGPLAEIRESWNGEENVPTWFINQKERNLDMNYRGSIDWDNLNALTTRLWLDAERSLSDNEIRALMGGTMTAQLTSPTLDTGYNAEADEGSFYYNFPQGYTDMETLRSDINDGRGSVVKCWDSNRPSWMTGCSGTSVQGQNEPDNATESHFGPNDIIAEEVRDFKNFLFNQRNEALRITSTESTEEDRNSLIAMLGEDSANPLFEECMNELFETDIIPGNYPDDYTEMDVMRDIRNIQNINDLTDDHISYIRLKLKKIAQTDETDAMSCMDKLNIGESICNTGIADKILRSAYLVASMMGMNNLDVSQIERGTGEYRKLTRLINDLGYLLPQAFKKIIDISLLYEEQYCGSVSTSTRMMEQMYDNLYTNNREVNIDIVSSFDINSFIDNDPIYFMQKVGVVLLIAYCITMVLRAFREVKQVVE